MWHILHFIVRPVEVALGLFCVLTAALLYPGEEGKIQSKFEDFWIRVDDYRQGGFLRHAVFMTQLAKLETSFLDRGFGPKLVSGQALGISFCFAGVAWSVIGFLEGHSGFLRNLSVGFLFSSALVGAASIFVRKHRVVRWGLIAIGLIFLLLWTANWQSNPRDAGRLDSDIGMAVLGSFVCDVIFIALTRWLVRWAGEMTSTLKVAGAVILNLLVAFALVFPVLLSGALAIEGEEATKNLVVPAMLVGFSNLFDVGLALLFVVLAVVLQVHRGLWPLLTRTLFRMQDMGTIGRRAILTTVGIALLSPSVFLG